MNPQPIRFLYKNHRGEVRWRTAIPLGVQWMSTQWHPEPQWILHAHDIEKDAYRSFALGNCSFESFTTSDDPKYMDPR